MKHKDLIDKNEEVPETESTQRAAAASCLLKEVCEAKGISIYSIGKSLGIHQNQLYTYTNNQTYPSIKMALDIAKFLGVDVNDLWILK